MMENNNTSSFLSTDAPPVKHKIIFLGDQHVGKTSIIERFLYDSFNENQHATIGVDFMAKSVVINSGFVRLQLWDTAGQERFRSLIPSYLRDATCAVIVFELTKKTSFENADRWIKDYFDSRGADAPLVLIGNKIDSKDSIEVTLEEIEQKAKSYKMPFFLVSAKTGENVMSMFKELATILHQNGFKQDSNKGESTPENSTGQTIIKLNKRPEQNPQIERSKGCCS